MASWGLEIQEFRARLVRLVDRLIKILDQQQFLALAGADAHVPIRIRPGKRPANPDILHILLARPRENHLA